MSKRRSSFVRQEGEGVKRVWIEECEREGLGMREMQRAM